MIKIIDDVDLKELEMFGFEKYIDEKHKEYYVRIYCTDTETIVDVETREVRDIDLDSFLTIVDLGESTRVCDLFKAGLVEKVGENNG